MKNPTLLVVVAIVIGIMILPVAQTTKLVLSIFTLLIILYVKRGYIFVAIGSRLLSGKNPNPEKGWRYYEMGWRAGLPPKYTIMLGNLFVQRGDAHVALQIYDSVINKQLKARTKDGEIIASAKISKSMALWVLDKKEEAIDSLQVLREEGRMDANLAVNLGSYLLEMGRLDEVKSLIDESTEQLPESPGMTDNRGHYLYLTGALHEAQRLYDVFITDGTPRFPEAYVHAAQVKIALGKHRTAVVLLRKALECPFYQITTVKEEDVSQMLSEQKELAESAVNEDELIEDVLERALYEDEVIDEDFPNTDIDEDDEVEPNIELTPEDYKDETDPEVLIDPEDVSELESVLFDDDYDGVDDHDKK